MAGKFLKLACVLCFIFVLEDGLNLLSGNDEKQSFLVPSVEAGFFKKILDKIRKAKPPSNRRKADQASDNLDGAIDTAREIAERHRKQERKEHERRRAHEKATRDERRMHGNKRSGRDRSREKANRDCDRMDRMDRGK